MELTSFPFLCFYGIVLILYYCLPVRFRWMMLLCASVLWYLMANEPVLIAYPVISCLVAILAAKQLAKNKEEPYRQKVLWVALALLLGILIAVKYLRFANSASLLVPVGLSFYTFSLASYVIDVYYRTAPAAKQSAKILTYGMFFPLMTSGPILKYREDAEPFLTDHRLRYENLTFGVQRMLWGFFQKLVLSERLSVLVAEIYGAPETYTGVYVWIGTAAFAFRLYTDFSGCMDIVLGIAETFGLKLPENFQAPFLSKSISEYWRRWHITLGAWMRDYVFYPLLRTKLLTSTGKALRSRFGKKQGGRLNNYLAMLVLWTAVGLWHGGDLKYVIGSGLLHWAYIVLGEVTLPFWTKLFAALHIPVTGRFADAVRVVRTFFLVNIGFVFFRADSTAQALLMLRNGLPGKGFHLHALMDGSLLNLGLDAVEMTITLLSLAILIAVSVMRQRHAEEDTDRHLIRKRIAALPLPARWVLWYALLFFVLMLGQYGPGYSAAEFIYEGF